MPLDSIICRKILDEEHNNDWVCQCPRCLMEKEEEKAEDDQARHKI